MNGRGGQGGDATQGTLVSPRDGAQRDAGTIQRRVQRGVPKPSCSGAWRQSRPHATCPLRLLKSSTETCGQQGSHRQGGEVALAWRCPRLTADRHHGGRLGLEGRGLHALTRRPPAPWRPRCTRTPPRGAAHWMGTHGPAFWGETASRFPPLPLPLRLPRLPAPAPGHLQPPAQPGVPGASGSRRGQGAGLTLQAQRQHLHTRSHC